MAKPIGKSTSIGVRLRGNLEKKRRSHSWQLRTAFARNLHLIWKPGKWLKQSGFSKNRVNYMSLISSPMFVDLTE